jgi:hypothetical protein
MKTYNLVIILLFIIFTAAGCSIEDPVSTENDDTYTEEESPEYVPPIPPQCESSILCRSIMSTTREEQAEVSVSVKNTSPDCTAYKVCCTISFIDGDAKIGTQSITFDDLKPGKSASGSVSLVINRPNKVYKSFVCTMTWYDLDENYYQSEHSSYFSF